LIKTVSGSVWLDDAGKYLKATIGWNYDSYEGQSGNGQDTYGFRALPGGFACYEDDGHISFSDVGGVGFWWIADGYSWYISVRNVGSMDGCEFNSVRCIQD